MSVTRVAAVDCGTHSLRLLVADVDRQAGRSVDVARRLEIVRLGAGVDATGRLSDDALARSFAALDDYAALVAALGAERVGVVATSATRDAANRDTFTAGVTRRLGVAPTVLTGTAEAALSFAGATRDLPAGLATPRLVVDIGGGSTELVRGTTAVDQAWSVDMGCVRLSERALRGDPPSPASLAAAASMAADAIASAARHVALHGAGTVVGVAGTVTTLAALDARVARYDPGVTHHYRLGADRARALTAQLSAMDRAQRAALPALHPGRVDVIVAGGLLLCAVLDATGADAVVVSEHDLLDGLAWSLAC